MLGWYLLVGLGHLPSRPLQFLIHYRPTNLTASLKNDIAITSK